MCRLDLGEAAINLLELRIALGVGQRPVEGGAVLFALEIAAIARDRVPHGRSPQHRALNGK